MTDVLDAGTPREPWHLRLRVIPIMEVLLLAAALVMPAFLDFFWVVFATKVLILAMLAISFDLNWGYSGILSFGQALFFGTSAYVVALIGRDFDFALLWVTLPLAALVGLVLSGLVGWFLLLGKRTPSVIFVALGTLTGSYAAERLAAGWTYIGAANGLSGIPILDAGFYEFFEGPPFYYLALGFLVFFYLLSRFVVRSQFGLVLAGMREREDRLAYLGYRVQVYKALIFSFAGLIAGVAGALYAYHEGFAGPKILGIALSTQVVLYALFGGVGTLIGAVLGVIFIEYGSLVLSDYYPGIWPILLGILLLLVIMFQPTGLMGLIASERERVGVFGQLFRRGGDKEEAP